MSADRLRAVIWDLDGTLADDRGRAHHVEVEEGKKRDWKSYFDAIEEDPPIAASIAILRALHRDGFRIIYLTGRPEYTRSSTERWLRTHGLDEYDRLLMRPAGERRPAGEFKVEVLDGLAEKYEILCAFEDRIDVAEHLRIGGIPVFLYGGGAEAAAEALEILDIDQEDLTGEDEDGDRDQEE